MSRLSLFCSPVSKRAALSNQLCTPSCFNRTSTHLSFSIILAVDDVLLTLDEKSQELLYVYLTYLQLLLRGKALSIPSAVWYKLHV